MNRSLSALDAQLDGIAHVLRDRRLRVPSYQRSYAWGPEQVSMFWEDLRLSMQSTKPAYFLGTIVLSSEGDPHENTIIDGQQRLVTTAILLAAIRDQFADAEDSARAQALQSQFLTYRDLNAGVMSPRLTLNSTDADFFTSHIAEGQQNLEPSSASTRRLQVAYNLLRDRVDKEAKAAGPNWKDWLIRWVEFLDYDVRTIVVGVPSSSDAFLIFETLNDRGLPLTVADLLKNYLYWIAGSRVGSVEAAWETIASNLESSDNEQLLLDFLRQYWSSYFGATRERDLYRSFRTRVNSDTQAQELVDRLAEASVNFLALATGDASLWSEKTITQATVDSLQVLRLSQNRPLLLAAMEHFAPDELDRLVRAIISWSVRGIIVGGIGGGKTERYFCDAAVRVREGRAQTTEDVLQIIGDIVPTDEQFESAAATVRITRSTLARYLLLAFERHNNGISSPEVVPRESLALWEVQHLVPLYASGNQTLVDDQRVAEWSRRLGNFILTRRDINNKDANRTRMENTELFHTGTFVGTRAQYREGEWPPRLIEEQQRTFAAAAPAIWPREP